ncbi:large-conductance mechanosensitive channel protein MscL [Belliella kenyensis]|uniref:Large-conductance mechanosensitive channel n=1 Tax=Belliella kenyensis TaxID=1472724 RepID=A0ABV8EGL5_9BACT|nr:large-conductance mechanosensitive channel protein MscL [Belliella kenyensis]MCH7401896.1 large-conductance mechanosensitive channel protein MscL [Belliella kenyensis]MDN3604396.1 large-conductance mechanosensitive channel protein MscL [Belliella kenyensis]
MGMLKEFKEFAMKGNVLDLAIAVIIGGAFGRIVSSFVNDIIMPPIGILIGGVDFKDLSVVLRDAYVTEEGREMSEVVLSYGNFIQNVVDFLIIAFVIFLVIKGISLTKKKKEPVPVIPVTPPKSEILLEEIRDLLKKQG